jgi:hypothetical protein
MSPPATTTCSTAARVACSAFDAGVLLFHLDLGGSADLDHDETAGELGNALLSLLLIVMRGGSFSLLTD